MLTRCAEEKGPGDYWVDEKAHQVLLTEEGYEHAEAVLAQHGILKEGRSLYEPPTSCSSITSPCAPTTCSTPDQQYVVQNGEIVIVDEFTGRLMAGRRWSMACTRPSRPRKASHPEREPDAGLDHLPELFPHVRQAGPA